MAENPSSKSSKVQTDNADITADNVAGGALVIGNNKTQTSGDLVKVTGTAGQSALNVTKGNTTLASLSMLYTAEAKIADFTAEAGKCYLITKVDGCDVTLPAPTIGARIKFVFGAVTSSNHTITTDDTSTLFNGYALMIDTGDGTAEQHKVFAPDGSDDDVFTMNGTTTGVSSVVELVGTATNKWFAEATVYCSGVVATPWS